MSNSEECCSSESGWTTYLTSPTALTNTNTDFDDFTCHGELTRGSKRNDTAGGNGGGSGGEDDDDDDDSMASDASSGTPGKQHGKIYNTCQEKKSGHCCSQCWDQEKGVFSSRSGSKNRDSSI